jgi:hypothetical protein
MITNGLVSLLLSDSTIAGIAGNRIQPIPAPETLSDFPCIAYQVASDVSDYTLTSPTGVTMTRVVFDCLAQRYLDARNLALAVKAALTAYQGTLPDGTVVYFTEIVNLVDGFDDGSRISKTSVHAVMHYADTTT